MSLDEQIEYFDYLKFYDPSSYDKKYHNELKKKSTNCRANNGYNESNNIKTLIKHLNNKTDIGILIINRLKEKLDISFKKAIDRKGCNRKTHYDFIIIDQYNVEYKVEHKGSCTYKKISITDKPWTSGVQFANIGCDKLNIGKIYAKIWYDTYIFSNYLKNIYSINSVIPTFNTWYKQDCCSQGNPKTLFGIELKDKYRNTYGNTSLLHLRKKVNDIFYEKFKNDSSISETLQKEISDIANECLIQKDIWIQINGDIDNKVEFEIYGKQFFKSIGNVICIPKKDLYFDFDSSLKFKILLRWGKGCGFSNLRIDFK